MDIDSTYVSTGLAVWDLHHLRCQFSNPQTLQSRITSPPHRSIPPRASYPPNSPLLYLRWESPYQQYRIPPPLPGRSPPTITYSNKEHLAHQPGITTAPGIASQNRVPADDDDDDGVLGCRTGVGCARRAGGFGIAGSVTGGWGEGPGWETWLWVGGWRWRFRGFGTMK